ncbi:MAG TPA: acyltransferase family protein [Acidimicrobiales bacterium]|nr:acyltransferase family protein [Acidimicrobiales bacterium]
MPSRFHGWECFGRHGGILTTARRATNDPRLPRRRPPRGAGRGGDPGDGGRSEPPWDDPSAPGFGDEPYDDDERSYRPGQRRWGDPAPDQQRWDDPTPAPDQGWDDPAPGAPGQGWDATDPAAGQSRWDPPAEAGPGAGIGRRDWDAPGPDTGEYRWDEAAPGPASSPTGRRAWDDPAPDTSEHRWDPAPRATGATPSFLSPGYDPDPPGYAPRRPHQSPYDPGLDPTGPLAPPRPSYDPEPGYGAPDPGYGDPQPDYGQGYADPDQTQYQQAYDTGYDQGYEPRLDQPPPDLPPDPRRPAKADRVPGDLGPKLPHLPGLNGLRAVALLAVLAYAHDVDLLQGGFLGISSVFTLSGFLMATLALAEWSQTTQLLFGRFWDRRARNLAPPYFALLAVVVALQTVVRVGSVPTFRGDVYAALGFVTNWRLAFPSEGFASSFAELSALRHLWPVAITAQVYLLFPLVFVVLMLVTGRQWRASGYAFAALAAASFGAAWMLSGNTEARRIAYYGTHTRAGEILVGVVLAYAVLTPGFRTLLSRPLVMNGVRNGAPAALLALLALWFLVPLDSPSLFHGVTIVNALLTGWVILAVTMPGPAASILGFAPLRHLGEVSYAAYLFHWPLYLLLDEDRIGFSGPPLFGVRLAATLAAAVVSYWVIQGPFRLQLKVKPTMVAAGLVTCAAVLAAAVFVLPVNPPANISLAIDDGQGPGDLEVVEPAVGDATARVLLVGDDTAGSLTSGFAAWNQSPEHEDQQFLVDTHVTDSCPLGGSGLRESLGQRVEASLDCESWRPRLPKMLEAADYDVIVVAMGGADLGERKIGRQWQHLGDPAYDVWMAEQIDGLADVLASKGVPVLWATYPHLRLTDPDQASSSWTDFDDNDPHRVDRLNELIESTVGNRDRFEVADLAAWLYEVPRGEFNEDIRVGTTFTEPGALQTVETWLAPKVLSAAGADTETPGA